MSVYVISFISIWESLTPPLLRKDIIYAWGSVLVAPLQYLYEIIFNEYTDGSNAFDYVGATAYVVGDKVIYTDRGVYECIVNSTGNAPTDTTYWKKIADNYIGIRERIKYTSQKMTFEYSLNRWFQTTGIYITNTSTTTSSFLMGQTGEYSSVMPASSAYQQNFLTEGYVVPSAYNYTIYVPVAKFNSLATNDTDRENIIRAFADRYNLAGMIYNVQKY